MTAEVCILLCGLVELGIICGAGSIPFAPEVLEVLAPY